MQRARRDLSTLLFCDIVLLAESAKILSRAAFGFREEARLGKVVTGDGVHHVLHAQVGLLLGAHHLIWQAALFGGGAKRLFARGRSGACDEPFPACSEENTEKLGDGETQEGQTSPAAMFFGRAFEDEGHFRREQCAVT